MGTDPPSQEAAVNSAATPWDSLFCQCKQISQQLVASICLLGSAAEQGQDWAATNRHPQKHRALTRTQPHKSGSERVASSWRVTGQSWEQAVTQNASSRGDWLAFPALGSSHSTQLLLGAGLACAYI